MARVSVERIAQGSYTLTGQLSRLTVPTCWPDYLKQWKKAKEEAVLIDLQKIDHSDTSGLAWLINMLKAAKAAGVKVSLANVPQSMLKIAKISDVEGFLSVQ